MVYRSLAEIKPNPKNPRVIKDEKFNLLVESLRSFPEMLEKRPLVCVTDPVDGKIFPLGGNQRLKAATQLKFKAIPVELADDWTEEQRAEFVIKDNLGSGSWNFAELTAGWNEEKLTEWGVDLPDFAGIEEGSDEFSLASGDKAPFQQMSFILSDGQASVIQQAIRDIKETEGYKHGEFLGNFNTNGNAIYLIVKQWAERKKS